MKGLIIEYKERLKQRLVKKKILNENESENIMKDCHWSIKNPNTFVKSI
jgi:adenylate kinase